MPKTKLVKLGFLFLVLAGLIASQPRTASALLCCSTCDTRYDSCVNACAPGDSKCQLACTDRLNTCERSCSPSC